MSARHAFEPLASSPDVCGFLENVSHVGPELLVPCRMPRAAAIHDTFSSSREHPGLAKLRPSARLAALLGCTVDELRDDLARLLSAPLHTGSMRDGDLVHDAEGKVFRLDGRELDGRARVELGRCLASVDDDCRCERARGHRGLHAHIHELWKTGGPPWQHTQRRTRRCYAVCAKPGAKLATYRCVLELGHESDAHELDNGEVFK